MFVISSCSGFGESESALFNFFKFTSNENINPSLQEVKTLSFEHVDDIVFWEWLNPDNKDQFTKEAFAFANDSEVIEPLSGRLYEHLEELNLNHPSLSDKEVYEYRFLTHLYLSALYSRKTGNQNEYQEEFWEESISHKKEALKNLDLLTENYDADYSKDRAFPELELTNLKCKVHTDRRCFERYQDALVKYQHTGYGAYPEWFVNNMVLPSMFYYLRDHPDDEIRNELFELMDQISDKMDRTGISASLLLARHYTSQRNLDKVKLLLNKIEENVNRDELTDDLKAHLNHIEQFLAELERMQSENQQ